MQFERKHGISGPAYVGVATKINAHMPQLNPVVPDIQLVFSV
jgi:hypothetical protein